MASLSNINGLFDVHSTGAILFSTSHGTTGQVLRSNGNAAPTWVDVPPIVDDRYVLVAGDTMTGNLAINGTNTLSVGGALTVGGVTTLNAALTGTSATFSSDVFSDGLYVNSTTAVSGTQVAIVQDGEQNLQRWGTANSGQASYRFRIDQDMKFIANSGSGDNLIIYSDTGNIEGTTATFSGLVSGITPTAAANFVTKAYADGLTPGAGVFLPLAGGTLTGGLTGTTAGFSGSITASGNSNSFGNTTIAALSASTGTFSASVTAAGNSNSFGATTFSDRITAQNGITVTGGATGADIYINNTSPTLGFTDTNSFTDANDIYIIRGASNGSLQFQWYDNSAGTTTQTFIIDSSGNATFAGKISSVKELINVNSANGVRSGGFEVQDNGDLFIGTATTAGNIVLETGNSTNGLPSTGTARLTVNSTGATFAGNVTAGYGFFNAESLTEDLRVGGIYGNLGLYIPDAYDMQFSIATTASKWKFTLANIEKFVITPNGDTTANGGGTFGGNVKTTGAAIGTTQADGDYLAKLYTASADGFLSLYTGQATPIEQVRISSYGPSYIVTGTLGGFGLGSSVTTGGFNVNWTFAGSYYNMSTVSYTHLTLPTKRIV